MVSCGDRGMSARLKIGVVGTGYLGRLHARVLSEMPEVELVGFVEHHDEVASEVSASLGIPRMRSLEELQAQIDCAVVATPTVSHFEVASQLLRAGCDVMIEKPITVTISEARQLLELAAGEGRLIQVGHVERYNPAVAAVTGYVVDPRFIEAQRIAVFVGRSLDIDVLLDLMVHDLNLVLSFVKSEVKSIHAVGVPVLTDKVDIANVRLEFENGAVANLTASRVSSERVRKFRIFGHDYYISVDTKEQEAKGFVLQQDGAEKRIIPMDLKVEKKEPLRAELEQFVEVVRSRESPLVTGEDGLKALDLALRVGVEIQRSMGART